LCGHRRDYGLRFLGGGLLLSSPRSEPHTADQFAAGVGGFQPFEVLARGLSPEFDFDSDLPQHNIAVMIYGYLLGLAGFIDDPETMSYGHG
jgi:hypothetical protein